MRTRQWKRNFFDTTMNIIRLFIDGERNHRVVLALHEFAFFHNNNLESSDATSSEEVVKWIGDSCLTDKVDWEHIAEFIVTCGGYVIQRFPHDKERIIHAMTDYMVDHTYDWMQSHDAWNSFPDTFFPIEHRRSSHHLRTVLLGIIVIILVSWWVSIKS